MLHVFLNVPDCLVLSSPMKLRSRNSSFKNSIMYLHCLQLNEEERLSLSLERTQNGQSSSTSLQSQPSFSSSQVRCCGDLRFDTFVMGMFVLTLADIISYLGRSQWRFLI